MEPTTGFGTTLETLAPYLPYDIEVAWRTKENHKPLTYKTGLQGFVPGSGFAVKRKGDILRWAQPGELLPVLRPFSELTAPLSDGFIPALTVATLLVNDWAARYRFELAANIGNRKTVHVFEWDAETGEHLIYRVSILADWNLLVHDADMKLMHCENLIDAFNYLRSQHFAVGLEPHQYIAKEPATPTKKERTGEPQKGGSGAL